MILEAVVLTGGASQRMGQDKSQILIDGQSLVSRLIHTLQSKSIKATILGRNPVEGVSFIQDKEEFGGPLSALSLYKPSSSHILVLSCDLPHFDYTIVELLTKRIGDHGAAIPELGGRMQPLCALYTAESISKAKLVFETGDRRIMSWISTLDVITVSEEDMLLFGIKPSVVKGVNTPQELRSAIKDT